MHKAPSTIPGIKHSLLCLITVLILGLAGFAPQVIAQDAYNGEVAPHGLNYDQSYEYFPQDRGWLYNEELRSSLNDTFTGAWFRLEYLDWDIRKPKDTVMSETIPGITKPQKFFPGQDLATNTPINNIRTPNFDDLGLMNNQGIRGTFGLPLGDGDFEASVYYLQKNNQLVSYPEVFRQNIPNTLVPTHAIGIGVLINGNPQVDNPFNDPSAVTFNTDFNYRYETFYMGAEASYLHAPNNAGPGLQIRPLFGLRYLQLDESFAAHGVNVFQTVDPNDPNNLTTRNAFWESAVDNNILGPQIGFQSEFVTQYFTLGIKPKAALGFNRINYQVKSSQFIRNTDPQTFDEDQRNQVSPILDLSAYGKIPITEHIHFFCSYQTMWVGRVSRPSDTIRYNVQTVNGVFTPDLQVRQELTDMFIQGITAGFECHF